jgi:hypothetical protein
MVKSTIVMAGDVLTSVLSHCGAREGGEGFEGFRSCFLSPGISDISSDRLGYLHHAVTWEDI